MSNNYLNTHYPSLYIWTMTTMSINERLVWSHKTK